MKVSLCGQNIQISVTRLNMANFQHNEIFGQCTKYRNLGIPDWVDPPGVWDNAHAASLEVYSVNELVNPLYHP